MVSTISLLTALQHGDSFFPSGAVSFSWGLETLFTEEVLVSAADVEAFIHSQLRGRWATFDRAIVVAAHRAATDEAILQKIDETVEAQNLAFEVREGSRRSGLALLQVHMKMETPGAKSYLDIVRASKNGGHLNTMQGFLWARAGMDQHETEVVSGHTICVGLLGAAVRLGAIGHIDCQRILRNASKTIDELMEVEVLPYNRTHTFTPHAEIAIMRHEVADSRLFAN